MQFYEESGLGNASLEDHDLQSDLNLLTRLRYLDGITKILYYNYGLVMIRKLIAPLQRLDF